VDKCCWLGKTLPTRHEREKNFFAKVAIKVFGTVGFENGWSGDGNKLFFKAGYE